MTTQDVLDRFVDKCPLAVMARSIIEALLGDQLNEVFEQNPVVNMTTSSHFRSSPCRWLRS